LEETESIFVGEELELEKIFVEIIDTMEEKHTNDIIEILADLSKKYPKESLCLLSEVAKSSKSLSVRNYAINILTELALEAIKPAKKPEISERHGEGTGG
jgi:hypothetical protein